MKKIVIILLSMLIIPLFAKAASEGDVIITEIMYNANSSETTTKTQFIEIANTTSSSISLNNWTIDDEDDDGPNTFPNVSIPAYGIIVICGSTEVDFQNAFGTGFSIISILDEGQTMINLSNSPSATSEIIQIKDNTGVLIDEVNYDDTSPWPSDPGGVSIYLDQLRSEMSYSSNDNGSNWSNSQNGVDGAFQSSTYGVWDAIEISSPGNINGYTTLPVTLSTFTAQYLNSKPTLYWQTQSEEDNMGWFIYRNTIEDFTSAEKITGMIEGHGTTTQPQSYIYEDAEQLQIEQTYYYWLESVDYSGTLHHYDRVAQITIPPDDPGQNVTPPVAYDISADPNPFSHSTEITFALTQTGMVDMAIYNVKGQMVKSFGTVMTNADEEVSFQWNGKDNAGKALSNGVYLYSVKVNGKDYATKQLILMK